MRRRGGFTMAFSGALMLLLGASFVSPALRDRLFDVASNILEVLRQLKQFVLQLFGGG